ncbi:hypothetical protein BUZ59_08765 [Staphylococcus kloosii]|nr:hypothetical protein C7J89_03010 [Staphylococcus kloosii]PTJ76242.1 hypothetical protein BUZ59_08765 [Staphylococcus kloosii]
MCNYVTTKHRNKRYCETPTGTGLGEDYRLRQSPRKASKRYKTYLNVMKKVIDFITNPIPVINNKPKAT